MKATPLPLPIRAKVMTQHPDATGASAATGRGNVGCRHRGRIPFYPDFLAMVFRLESTIKAKSEPEMFLDGLVSCNYRIVNAYLDRPAFTWVFSPIPALTVHTTAGQRLLSIGFLIGLGMEHALSLDLAASSVRSCPVSSDLREALRESLDCRTFLRRFDDIERLGSLIDRTIDAALQKKVAIHR